MNDLHLKQRVSTKHDLQTGSFWWYVGCLLALVHPDGTIWQWSSCASHRARYFIHRASHKHTHTLHHSQRWPILEASFLAVFQKRVNRGSVWSCLCGSLWNMHYCSLRQRRIFIPMPRILSAMPETRHGYTQVQIVESGPCSCGRKPKQTIRSYNSMFHALCSKKLSQAVKFPINPQVPLLIFPVCFCYTEIWACFISKGSLD